MILSKIKLAHTLSLLTSFGLSTKMQLKPRKLFGKLIKRKNNTYA